MKFLLSRLLLVSAVVVSASAQITIYSNSGSGDTFTHAGSTNTGQAVGATSWYYNNVRNNGEVGISTTFARSGNGSVYFQANQAGATSSKADIEFYASASANGAGNYATTGASLGKLGDLSALSYDWLRASGGSANGHFHTSLRLLVSNLNPNQLQFGYLVFERVYNGFGAAPVDLWQSDDILGSDYTLWSTGSLPGAFSDYSRTLSNWKNNYGDLFVLGVSSGVGSGWDGTYEGAVDNLRFGFSGNNTTYNFEVPATANAVPEPSTYGVLGALVLLGAMIARRRRA